MLAVLAGAPQQGSFFDDRLQARYEVNLTPYFDIDEKTNRRQRLYRAGYYGSPVGQDRPTPSRGEPGLVRNRVPITDKSSVAMDALSWITANTLLRA